MRTLIIIGIGVALAFAFDTVGAMVNNRRVTRGVDGGWLFVWAWLGVVIADFGVGVATGHPVLPEIAIHMVVYIVPATIAWFLARRRETPRVPSD